MHTIAEAIAILTAAGHATDDIAGAIDSLIGSGLSISEPDETGQTLITGDELAAVRDQLSGAELIGARS